ncbi:MAG: hypothetical protein ACYC3X_20345 [Pirellulaceae bacterium]
MVHSPSFPGLRGQLPRDPEWDAVLDDTSGIFADWIRWQTEAIRAVDPVHPITVGFNTVFACLPGAAHLDFVYLYAYTHGFDGCMKWVLSDHPLELSRQQCSWLPLDDLSQHIDRGRYGLFWSDGTADARPKPLVSALRFFRDWVDAGGERGELTVSPAPTRIGTGYCFQAERTRFVGHLRHAEPGFEFEARQVATVLLHWDANQAQLLSTADATVRIDLARLCGWRPDAEVRIIGVLAASRRSGSDLVLELLEGETVTLEYRDN